MALAIGEFENTNTHKYSPDSSALGFKILQTGREHMSCVKYCVSNQNEQARNLFSPQYFSLLTEFHSYYLLIQGMLCRGTYLKERMLFA